MVEYVETVRETLREESNQFPAESAKNSKGRGPGIIARV
jgi:hypothetical protein